MAVIAIMPAGSLPLGALSSLAWRNLWRNHRRTLIMLLAVVVGAWAMIFMTALMRGMVDEMIEDGIRHLPGHVQLHHPDYRDDPSIGNSLREPGGDLAAALKNPLVTAHTSRLRVPAMISSERASRGVTLLGVDPTEELAMGFETERLLTGRFLEGSEDPGLVVGRKLLERLETDPGKRVVLMSQDPGNRVADRGFRIVGVYSARLEALEERFVYAGLDTVQAMLGTPGLVSEIAALGDDYRDVDALEALLREAAPREAEVLPWYRIDRYLGMMMQVMDGFVLIWMVVVFLALSFGLVNTLMMAVFERIREIGLMQALGLKPSAIVWLVLLESALLLALGLLFGNLLAVATILPLRDGIDISVVAEGMEMMGASSVLYPALKGADLLLANAVVLGLGLTASLLPAWRASRYRPVEALAKT
jgi:ABC-type lipoprotein release transport system permease subunit